MTVPVHLKGLRRSFGATTALDGLDLEIASGEMVALLGPSGCGKTTALRIIAGFETADGGELTMDGQDVTHVPAHRRGIGMVFQSYSLFPHMTAAQNIGYGLRVRGSAAAERAARAAQLLELVGLPGRQDHYPHQLSGGQQQRVALARALAVRPRVLLLDEPLSALDAKVRLSLREEIRRIQLELGITTVFVTHDQEEALSVADRVAVMQGGRLEQCAAPAELYERPATPFVAEFVGTMNRLPGTVRDGGVVELFGCRLPVHGAAPGGGAGRAVEVLLRPEGLAVRTDAGAEGMSATVRVATFLGATTRLHLTTETGVRLKADVPSREAGELTPGARCTVTPHEKPVLVTDC
ncbi:MULTISPECIES: ABC transporter ATP-binding protein [unclassified Streptomyces]|uniref:ABC transporter ATP-binding protein n=1 Tax=unclassified Streptomyces TaxID=2593676 RepID=UPI0008859577|nr:MULTISPECIES: ABC transporter ATP-binding protein [unclassified Streptomyces]PBC82682.1 putative spermidine/putrescine transport system ATP-binding protein [Streptomyces sp. 2321.6]SDR47992.1 putative spermidine/putrescine transport system ATP-binding protein [Streptomyces sp. KS_16]SEC67586.1 putative spermidine/putrescine transport system ATP-binding protein [Streptomyces sp. 2133.1]SNC68758.1 putative spermidine/putrescine transport system ATP-binding protein [Streptomyces sp. 2114.4]